MRLVLGYLLKSLQMGDLDDDQKQAMAWSIALPGDDANPKLEQNLRSGPFPIMWTGDMKAMMEADPDSPLER